MSQTILDALADVEKASQEQAASSQALTQEVAGKMGDIDTKFDDAIQDVEQLISDVNVAIPTAITTTMNQTLYVDPVNGDDINNGQHVATAVKTINRAVELIPEHGGAKLDIRADLGFCSSVVLKNKHIEIYLNGFTFRQLTLPKLGTFLLEGDSRVIFASSSGNKGKVITALFDENYPTASDDTALLRRSYLYPVRAVFMHVKIELGDQAVGANALGAGGIGEFLFTHGEITVNEATVTPLIFRANNRHLLFTVNITTLPDGINPKDLVSGVNHYADGTPINILSSSDFTETV